MIKLLPLQLAIELLPLHIYHNTLFLSESNKDKKFLFHLLDKDSNSDFYFTCFPQDNSKAYPISYKPAGKTTVNSISVNAGNANEVKVFLEKWIEILKGYNSTPFFIDDKDPLIKNYTEEFYNELKLTDPDADYIPFEFNKQLQISQYILHVKRSVEKQKLFSIGDEDKQEELNAIEEECDNLVDNITKLSKNETLVKVAKVWAKCRKYSVNFISDTLYDLVKDYGKVFLISNSSTIYTYVAKLLE